MNLQSARCFKRVSQSCFLSLTYFGRLLRFLTRPCPSSAGDTQTPHLRSLWLADRGAFLESRAAQSQLAALTNMTPAFSPIKWQSKIGHEVRSVCLLRMVGQVDEENPQTMCLGAHRILWLGPTSRMGLAEPQA
jgi:hypothetical protein